MPRLSVVMIVKNESACLGACLDSVRGIADEIVVGDTGSTDGTRDIARSYGARVLEVPWADDFAAARNAVNRAAQGDWLLHLDADERLDAEGARRLRAWVDAGGDGADAAELRIANYCDAPRAWRWRPVDPGCAQARGYSGYIETRLLRLFRNRPEFVYRERVHENITESVLEHGGRIRPLEVTIHHYGADFAAARDEHKKRQYLAIARAKTAERPDCAKTWHDYAEQSYACGDGPEAERGCCRALEIEPRHLGASSLLANLFLLRGRLDDAEAILRGLLEHGVAPPHVVTALGAIEYSRGRLERALRYIEPAAAAEPKYLMAWYYLARVRDALGQEEAARAQWQALAAAAPSIDEFQLTFRAHRLRGEAAVLWEAGKHADALGLLVRALRLDPEDPLLHNDLGVALATLGETEKAKACFDRALRLVPGLPAALENKRALEPA